MASWSDLNHLILNLSLLIAGVTALTFTHSARDQRPIAWLTMRYAGFVILGLSLMVNALTLPDGLRFDFGSEVIALVGWRYGVLPALLVALPLAAYRIVLGGHGVGIAVTHHVLLGVVAGWSTGWLRVHQVFQEEPLSRRWWSPFALFASVNLLFFPAFWLAGHPFTEALTIYVMITLLSALGLFLAYEVKNSRLRALTSAAHFQQLAALDSLTGCFNRRQFDADVLKVIGPAYLLMLDIDLFKRINDTYGYDVGDRVLVALAETLRGSARATDRVYRLGGEEFAVLFRGGTLIDAQGAAERIRLITETNLGATPPLHGERITVSGGLVPAQGDRNSLLTRADDLLYKAKQAGRNRIVSGPVTT